MQQIPLQLVVNKDCQFDNFWAGPHKALIDGLRNWLRSPAFNCLYLQGAAGTGKSHLIQACCHELQSEGLRSIYMGFPELLSYWLEQGHNEQDDTDGWVEALLDTDVLFIDDIDADIELDAAEREAIDRNLFQLLNRSILAQTPRILFSSQTALEKLSFELKDLRSRLRLMQVLNLTQLSEEQVLGWLGFKAEQLGFKLDDDSAQFLLRRWPRDLHALAQALNRLNEFSLVEKRRVTVPAIKEALGI